jgi:tetratricopeptide (TPR) repeat protein
MNGPADFTFEGRSEFLSFDFDGESDARSAPFGDSLDLAEFEKKSEISGADAYFWAEGNLRNGKSSGDFFGGDFKGALGVRERSSRRLASKDRILKPMFGGWRVGGSDYYIQWLNTLYPTVSPQPAETKPSPDSTWPAAAIEISRSLVQEIIIDAGGIEVIRQNESFDPRWNRQTAASRQLELLSQAKWLSFSENAMSQTMVHWCDDQQRGSYSRAFQLGRVRKSTSRDLASLIPGRRAYEATKPLHESHYRYDVKLEHPADDRVVMILTLPKSMPVVERRIVIDTARSVILTSEQRYGDKLATSAKYQDYFQVAGSWWPAKVENFDAQGRRTSVTTQTVRSLIPTAFAQRISQEMPDPDLSQLLPMELPTVRRAEVAVAAGSANFEQRLVLLLSASLTQDWKVVLEQLAQMEKLARNKPALAWIRAEVLTAARKNDDVRKLMIEQADRIVTEQPTNEFFLAEYLLGKTSQVADQNEVLRLLERVRPLFERQPEVAIGPLRWEIRYTQALRSLQRRAELLPRQHALATTMLWDLSLQNSYARDLANSGDYDAARAWLKQELDRDVERSESEIRQLRTMVVTLLREQGRADELVAFFEEWVATNPKYQDTYSQYLYAYIMADRTRDADALARKWLKEGRLEGKLAPPLLVRLNAAAAYARGQRYRRNMNYIDPAWFGDLEETAGFFLGHQEHFYVASSIIDHYYFVDSDASDRLRAEAARRLVAGNGDLTPLHVASYVRWTVGRSEISVAQWKLIADTLRVQWEKIEEKGQRQILGRAILQIYDTHFDDTHHLPFIRQRIIRAEEDADATLVAALVNALFTELLSRGWMTENESEALTLIPRLSSSESPSERWTFQIQAVHRFVDRMLQARQDEDRKQLQDSGRPEKLTRAELVEKYTEFLQSAREGLAARLAEFRPESASEIIRQWVAAERMFLDLKLGRNFRQVAAECWVILGEAAPAEEISESATDALAAEAQHLELLQDLLRERALTMVSYLAVRRSAPKSLAPRVLKYVSSGMQLEGDVARAWQQQRFMLLVALDRPDDLELELRDWIRADEVPATWQLALGRLLAEQGKIEDAVTLFETVQRTSQLGPSDYSVLANWYLVTNRRSEHDRAKIEVFKSMEEYRIAQWLERQVAPWNRGGVSLPTEFDEDVAFAFQALFEKSNQPGNFVSQLRGFYAACRDFRLLRMVPDSLTGRTPQQIYPFLKSLREDLILEIRQEATAGELLARVAQVRLTVDAVVDLRALDLLESMIESQAANVLNQPGSHIDAAVAALERAFDRQWAEGEIRQMADLLTDLGEIKHATLNAERLRQLRELLKMTEPATEDRFYVSYYLAKALFYSHGQQELGLATMENALREISSAHPDGWPAHLNLPLDGYVTMLGTAARFAGAEAVLTKYLEDSLNAQQAMWLLRRRNRLYLRALRDDGRVSLGAGKELFVNLEKHLLEQTKGTFDDTHRRQTVTQIIGLYNTANDKEIAGYKQHLREFAFTSLPLILKRQTNDYQGAVRQTANQLNALMGPRVAVEFLIERFETYPERFAYSYESPWNRFGPSLAKWFAECKRKIGSYEPRLLALVLREIRHELQTRRSRNRYLYYRGYSQYFWTEKSGEFLGVAEAVYQEQKDSGRAVTYIAKYLDEALSKRGRAIEIMLVAYHNKLLDTPQQIGLCDMLLGHTRHAESIAILQPIVETSPHTMAYRTRLIRAYARSSRLEEMRTLLTATDEHFCQQGRWTKSNMAELAKCCLDVDLFAESVGYYDEVIALHQRLQLHSRNRSGAVSSYYDFQSRAYSGLGDAIKAVDAAAAGFIAAKARYGINGSSPHWIDRAMSAAKDLDAYAEHLNKQVETTGQDSPLIRQRLGFVYARKNRHAEAVVQLQLAIDLQPTDTKTHEALIKSYEQLKDHDAVVRQTLAWLDFDRHNLDLYKKLADRLKSDEALFERAATTIVEAAPHEAVHHQALAEIRQEQDRWNDAIDHWKHVVRLRALEPNGLLMLAAAQLHEERWDGARNSIQQLNQTDWPARFSQVRSEINELQRRLPQ